jgi:hypothetical protein
MGDMVLSIGFTIDFCLKVSLPEISVSSTLRLYVALYIYNSKMRLCIAFS